MEAAGVEESKMESAQSDDQLNSNSKANVADISNANNESSTGCKYSNGETTEAKLSKHNIVCNTQHDGLMLQPITEKVKFDWKIKNFDAICPTNCLGFRPCCSNVFAVGVKVGKPCKWCFELRYDDGYLSIVLCRDKIYVSRYESPPPAIPCKVSLISPNGSVALEGLTSANPTQKYEDVLSRVQAVAEKVGGFLHPRENSEWKQFVAIDELHANRDRYIREDGTVHFKMSFELIGLVGVKTAEELALERLEALRKEQQERHSKQLAADLETLMTNGECTNFVIRCESQVFSVHKQLIQARCPKVYDCLLELVNASRIRVCKSSDPILSKIATLNDVEAESMSAFLEYIYTGTVKQLPDVFSKWRLLLQLADRWEATKLKDLCFYKMLGIMDAENTGSFICLANLHEASEDIWEFITAFCKINCKALIKNESFNKCRVDNPDLFQFFDAFNQ